MTRGLIIDETIKAEIKAVIERAKLKPISLKTLQALAMVDKDVIALADRPPDFSRPQSESIDIPIGFRAAFSVEEQPAGLCWHLSVSVDTPGLIPNIEAAVAIADEFGFGNVVSRWLEEFAPGHFAINMVSLVEPTEGASHGGQTKNSLH